MSVIFGVRHQAGRNIEEADLSRLAASSLPWAPDGTYVLAEKSIGMGIQPYLTHDRGRTEPGPIADEYGNVLVLDGRLDNYEELRRLLDIENHEASDGRIMLTAFLQWGIACYSRFIGDWASAIWSERNQTLFLSRDHAGTRPLYFEENAEEVRWSSFLETLVAAQRSPVLSRQYVNLYLSGAPLGETTPYVGIESVPFGNVVVLSREKQRQQFVHWQCYPQGEIRYRDDREYERHFLDLLKQSVQRRTVSGAPILAHLSGGMDSSTIVCISDLLKRETGTPDGLLDTVSFFDDTEPSWNERPYFSAVEAQRGKTGEHVDVSQVRPSFQCGENSRSCLLPGHDPQMQEQTERFERRIFHRGYRTILSGLGGDELLGGVPTPLPELSDYLVRGQFPTLWNRAIAWSLGPRKPIVRQLWETIRFSAEAYLPQRNRMNCVPPWTILQNENSPSHVDENRQALRSRTYRRTPSVITTANTWCTLLGTLPNPQLTLGERREYRFPYLDRDLVDFLLQVPNEQLTRPGRRRSLMRRAVKGIVPEEVLERRRKGYLARSPMHTIAGSTGRMREIIARSYLVRAGHVDRHQFNRCLDQASMGAENRWAPALIRTCLFELWLQSRPFPSLSNKGDIQTCSTPVPLY